MPLQHLPWRTLLAIVFSFALLLPLASCGPPDASAQSTVSGVYTVNGKPAKLTQVTARQYRLHAGELETSLVFSSKDQGDDPRPARSADSLSADFRKFGDVLVVRITSYDKPQGTVDRMISGTVVHAALNPPDRSVLLSALDRAIKIEDFKMAGGEISGHLTSGGEHELHGFAEQKWQVDLTFPAKAP